MWARIGQALSIVCRIRRPVPGNHPQILPGMILDNSSVAVSDRWSFRHRVVRRAISESCFATPAAWQVTCFRAVGSTMELCAFPTTRLAPALPGKSASEFHRPAWPKFGPARAIFVRNPFQVRPKSGEIWADSEPSSAGVGRCLPDTGRNRTRFGTTLARNRGDLPRSRRICTKLGPDSAICLAAFRPNRGILVRVRPNPGSPGRIPAKFGTPFPNFGPISRTG